MFLKLFNRKSRLDHPLAEKRIEALNELDDSAQEQFIQIAKADEDINVRFQALARIDQTELLIELLDDDQLSDQVAERLFERLGESHPLLQDARLVKIKFKNISNVENLFEMTRKIHDPRQVADLFMQLSDTDLRLAAVANIDNALVLAQCERVSRGHDKAANRIARTRINRYKTLLSERDSALDKAEKLIVNASKASAADSHYASIRDAIEREWHSILEQIQSTDKLMAEFGTEPLDLDLLQARLPTRAKEGEFDTVGPQVFASILAKLQTPHPSEDSLERAEQEWLDALKVQQPQSEIAQEFYLLTQRLRKTLKQFESETELQAQIATLTETIGLAEPSSSREAWQHTWAVQTEAQKRKRAIERFLAANDLDAVSPTRKETWTNELNAAQENCAVVIGRCEELLSETRTNITSCMQLMQTQMDEGSIQKARSSEKRARSLISQLPQNKRDEFRSELTPLSAQLGQLFNWQSFATIPKRKELCNLIEELTKAPIEPEEQFNRIKELRSQWKALGAPLNREELALQRRYDEAANSAFEVCSTWFEQMSRVRSENYQKRTDLIDELQKLYTETDWETTDWRSIIATLRKAREAWKSYVPVERNKGYRSDRKFYRVTGQVQKKINERWQENARRKEEIIHKAQEATNDENLVGKQLIDVILQLQADWKEIGPTARKKEDALWRKFREYCDAAFADLSREKEARREGIEKNIEEATNLIDELLNKVSDLDTDAQDLKPSLIQQHRQSLEEIELPQRVRRNLERKLDKASQQISELIRGQHSRSAADRLRQLLELDRELVLYESSNNQPEGTWFERAGEDSMLFESRVPLSNANDALYDIVLRAEIAADLPVAEEDSTRRLQLQVQNLQQNIGKGSDSNRESATELVKDWIAVAHGEQPLRERFVQAIEAVLSHGASHSSN